MLYISDQFPNMDCTKYIDNYLNLQWFTHLNY